jgi:hypothetical protein
MEAQPGAARYASFREFYPFYLSEHRNATCRKLHFVGTSLVLGLLLAAVVTPYGWLVFLAPVAGYGFAWVGHFAFEKNRPATFRYPLWSFMGDWVMYAQLATGRIPFDERHPRARKRADPA